jgi:hypothetical protein
VQVVENALLMSEPRPNTMPTMTAAMAATIRPYSTADAPRSRPLRTAFAQVTEHVDPDPFPLPPGVWNFPTLPRPCPPGSKCRRNPAAPTSLVREDQRDFHEDEAAGPALGRVRRLR